MYKLLILVKLDDFSIELGKDIDIVEEYVRESIDVMDEDIFKGSYDKEWALKEQGKWEGERNKTITIAKAMKENNIDIEIISKCTKLSIEEIKKL